ncbi:MAG: hypothetical protein ACQER9_02855 [Nanobdellota archaeon]
MEKTIKRGIVICLFLAIFLFNSNIVISTDTIELLNEGNIVYPQEVTFKTCVNGTGIKNSYYCEDTDEKETLLSKKWNDKCAVSTIDLSEKPCSSIELRAKYLNSGILRKITKSVDVKKSISDPKIIINQQDWDGGWGSPSNTAYAIWILSKYSPVYDKKINEGLEWLKSNRNENYKCWEKTSGECSIYETARTLSYLKFAGINQTNKIYLDGIMWLDSQMNYIENNEWTIKLKPNEDGNCTVKYEGNIKFDDTVNEDEEIEIPISAEYESLINVSCPEMGEKIYLYDNNGRNIFYNYYQENNDEYFDYTIIDDEESQIEASVYRIPPPCWSADEKWDYCNRRATLYASLLDEITEEKRNLALEWLQYELRKGQNVGKYLSTRESVSDTSMILYGIDKDQTSLKDWLVYKQNNDGSWGDGNISERIKPTAYALMALKNLQFNGKEEVINDGTSWLSSNYNRQKSGNFENDAVSFIILRDTAKPLLKADLPLDIKNGKETSLKLKNPTEFNIKNIEYIKSEDIKDKIQIEGPESINKFENMNMKIKPSEARAGRYTGTIKAKSQNQDLITIPLFMQYDVKFDITASKEKVIVFSDNFELPFKITANSDFDCRLEWDGSNITSKTNFHFSENKEISIKVTANPDNHKMISGNFICNNNQKEFEIPFEFRIKKYNTGPIRLSEKK